MTARVTRTSTLTGITRTMEMSQYEGEEFEKRFNAWNNGYLLIQEAFPELSPEAREFIKNGITEEEWQKYIVEGLPIPKIA